MPPMVQLPPPDPSVPALLTLLGADASTVFAAAENALGFSVEKLTNAQVRYLPGRSVIVQYRSRIAERNGSISSPMLVATSGVKVPPDTLRLDDGDGVGVSLWRFPADPHLPGLSAATSKSRTTELLERLGAPSDDVRLRVRAYRATRRAVVEAAGTNGTVFMKVLRPSRVAALQERHDLLAPHVPIPHSLGWSQRLGIVAMQAMPGTTLRRSVESAQPSQAAPAALVELLDALPLMDDVANVVTPAHERFEGHARLIGTVLPESRKLLDALRGHIGRADSDEPYVTVHGDFHASQVLVEQGKIVGLVDVDTVGHGQRSSDFATLIGQLATLALMADNPAPLDEYTMRLLEDFDRRTDPAVLRARVAFVVVGLATGPFRVQTADWPEDTIRRLELALRWVSGQETSKTP